MSSGLRAALLVTDRGEQWPGRKCVSSRKAETFPCGIQNIFGSGFTFATVLCPDPNNYFLSNQEKGGKKSARVFNPSADKTFLSYNKISSFSPSLLCPTLSAALTVGILVKRAACSGDDNRGSQLEKRNSIKTNCSHQSPLFVKPPFLNCHQSPKMYSCPQFLLASSPITCSFQLFGTLSQQPPDKLFLPLPASRGI